MRAEDAKAFLSQSFQRFGLRDVGQPRTVLWGHRVVAAVVVGALFLLVQRILDLVEQRFLAPVSSTPSRLPVKAFIKDQEDAQFTAFLQQGGGVQSFSLPDNSPWKEIHLRYFHNPCVDRFGVYIEGVPGENASENVTCMVTSDDSSHPAMKLEKGRAPKGMSLEIYFQKHGAVSPETEFVSVPGGSAILFQNGKSYTFTFDPLYHLPPMTIRIDRKGRTPVK